MDSRKKIIVYADGGNRNTGNKKGGHVKPSDVSAWAYLIQTSNGEQLFDAAALFGQTNNRMEITAVGSAFRKITESSELMQFAQIELVLDSKYVLDALEKKWLTKWITESQTTRVNFDLWSVLYPMYIQLEKKITYTWVKGHKDTPGNLFVDNLLNKKMDQLINN